MRWIDGTEWSGAKAMPLDEEEELIRAVGEVHPRGVRVLGTDCYGFDLENGGKRDREHFANAPIAAEHIGEAVGRFLAAM
jgi:hypothetical protein